jgi:cell division protein WhiA
LPYYVKDELSKINAGKRCCRQAELSALIRTEGTLHLMGGNQLAIHTESENASVARVIIKLARELFGRTPDLSLQKLPRLRNQVCYCLSFYEGDNLLQILNELGILDDHGRPLEGVPRRLVRERCCKAAYLRGAFLGCGFLGDMQHNKHLEFNLSTPEMAEGILELLSELGIPASRFQRRSSYVVYLKKKESILELLALMGAHSTVLRIENELIVSSIKEDVNRRVNCETANLRKITRAAQEQIGNIRLIEEELGLEQLAPSLRDTALARLDQPDLSLEELGLVSDPPISKSAVYHRLSRIAAIARELRSG